MTGIREHSENKFHAKITTYTVFPKSKVNGANTQQTAFKICDYYWNMNILFSGGDNWYPAIIGSKAVYILNKFRHIFNKRNKLYRWAKITLRCGVMLGISKHFAKSEFQMFEPNSEIGAVNE